jgi:hypothetical protein
MDYAQSIESHSNGGAELAASLPRLAPVFPSTCFHQGGKSFLKVTSCHEDEIFSTSQHFRFQYAIYHRKTAIPKTGDTDSEGQDISFLEKGGVKLTV